MKIKVPKENLEPIFVAGPTASGKSDFAYYLADTFESQVISCDSMQIYKGLDVGTAKDPKEILDKYDVKMVDIVPVDYDFSVAEYAERAKKEIDTAIKNGKLPIIVGGTGLYFESLLYPMSFGEAPKDPTVRAKYEQELKEKGNECLYDKLIKMDPEAATVIHMADNKRIVRALEIMELTNKKWSEVKDNKPEINPIMVAFNTDRAKLYERINERVDKMMSLGLLDEVQSVNNFTYNSMKAIGYREFVDYNGDNLEQIIEKIKQDTRNYAKRQLTWFRKYPFIHWVEIGDYEDALSYIKTRLKTTKQF